MPRTPKTSTPLVHEEDIAVMQSHHGNERVPIGFENGHAAPRRMRIRTPEYFA